MKNRLCTAAIVLLWAGYVGAGLMLIARGWT